MSVVTLAGYAPAVISVPPPLKAALASKIVRQVRIESDGELLIHEVRTKVHKGIRRRATTIV